MLGWTAATAYAVGLIATDGCLINTGRHIAFVTCDLQLMETFLRCLGRGNRYRTELTRAGKLAYRVQFGDVQLYRWLESIGLMQRKSLRLGAIDVPDHLFHHLVRGLLDGDGTILNKTYRADTRDRTDYYWEYFQAKFVSASRPHLEWLRQGIKQLFGIDGYLRTYQPRDRKNPISELRYGKPATVRLLTKLYEASDAPRLDRKWLIWRTYAERNGHLATARP